MRNILLITLILMVSTISACGSFFKNHKHTNLDKMDKSLITNMTVKDAIEAFQSSDSIKWLSLFSEDIILLDDGHPRDFHEFSTEAIKIERFTSIDKIEDNSTSIYGQFHSDKWGDFKAYFKFHFKQEGKINMLEIGQANY